MSEQDFLANLMYVRIISFIFMLGLVILSMRGMFKHHKVFAFGLSVIIVHFLVVTTIKYALVPDLPPELSSLTYTLAIIVWVICWTIDLANFDKDKEKK